VENLPNLKSLAKTCDVENLPNLKSLAKTCDVENLPNLKSLAKTCDVENLPNLKSLAVPVDRHAVHIFGIFTAQLPWNLPLHCMHAIYNDARQPVYV